MTVLCRAKSNLGNNTIIVYSRRGGVEGASTVSQLCTFYWHFK